MDIFTLWITHHIMYLYIYSGAKVGLSGISWFMMSSARKNITQHIELVKRLPSSSKKPKTAALTYRRKLTKIIPPAVLIPGVGEVLFLSITLGRFLGKSKVKKVYLKSVKKTEDKNLSAALNMMGEANRAVYRNLKRDASYLSTMGHAEIARQSIITLNTLLMEANIGGIDLKRDPSITEAINNTAGLVSELLREEHSGIQSNIDSYLSVVGNIKKDLAAKESVFMETAMSAQNNTDVSKH